MPFYHCNTEKISEHLPSAMIKEIWPDGTYHLPSVYISDADESCLLALIDKYLSDRSLLPDLCWYLDAGKETVLETGNEDIKGRIEEWGVDANKQVVEEYNQVFNLFKGHTSASAMYDADAQNQILNLFTSQQKTTQRSSDNTKESDISSIRFGLKSGKSIQIDSIHVAQFIADAIAVGINQMLNKSSYPSLSELENRVHIYALTEEGKSNQDKPDTISYKEKVKFAYLLFRYLKENTTELTDYKLFRFCAGLMNMAGFNFPCSHTKDKTFDNAPKEYADHFKRWKKTGSKLMVYVKRQ